MPENLRVRVDPSTGAVEVEGPEPFVREMLERFTPLMERPAAPERRDSPKSRKAPPKRKPEKADTPSRPKRSKGGRVEIDEELRQELQQQRAALQAYLQERKHKSRQEEAAIVAGFLKEQLNRDAMNETQYVTVLRVAGRTLPERARQVLLDAKNKSGLLLESGKSFELSAKGHNFAEHGSLNKESDG